MRAAGHLLSDFGILAGISRLALGLSLGVMSSCALDDVAGQDNPSAPDPDGDGASEAVCTSGPYRCLAHVHNERAGRFVPLAAPIGYGPADLQAAYKIDPNVIVGKPVVGIAIAYGYAAVEQDLAMYRSTFGLPPCTIASGCLKLVNQRGQASPLPAEPPPTDDWRIEQALDLDMVSAACPKCNILVVQADDNSGDGLFIAQNVAAQLGATVISNSWGGPEDPQATPADIAQLEQFFIHPNIAIFAASGDRGFNDMLPGGAGGPGYPATSANVISVGGTRLVRDTSTRGWAETAWSSGGSACSTWIAKPAHQVASPCKLKATSEIAAVGDPGTPVAVYSVGKWRTVGGTSASAPFVAGIVAATGNGAVASGAFVAASASKLFDVTTGTNGSCAPDTLLCTAAVGWDGPTGYGTPNAKALAPASATPPTTPGSGGNDPNDPQDVSGGCSTSGSGAGLLLGLALLALRRRRGYPARRSAAPTSWPSPRRTPRADIGTPAKSCTPARASAVRRGSMRSTVGRPRP
jgi:MYXO-CTERM domain-containing protein